MYSQILQGLPNWVLKGEYGDISNLLNDREQEFETTRQAEQVNDQRQIQLDEQKRDAQFEEELRRRGIFTDNGNGPATLRDMYGRVRDVAKELGNVDAVFKMEEQLQKLEQAKAKEERAKLLESRDDQAWEWKKQDRGRKGVGREEKTTKMYNPETKDFARVPASQVDDAKKRGYIDEDHPEMAQFIQDAQDKRDKAAKSAKKESRDPWYLPTSPAPARTTTTPTPAPGDQVKTIIRNRSSAVKGQ
jgi:hypothetical protein